MNIDQIKAIIKNKVEGKIIAQHDDKGHHYLTGCKNGKPTKASVLVDSVTTKIILEKPHLLPWGIKMAFEWMEDKWYKMDETNREDFLKSAQQAPFDVRDDAGDTGTTAHNMIEHWVNQWIANDSMPGDIAGLFADEKNYKAIAAARSAEALFKKENVIPIASELLVGSKKYNSAGTLDMLVYNLDTNELELWDWKSSNAVHDSYAIQVSAYKRFFEDMTKLKIAKCKIMHLSKSYDKCVVYRIPDDEVAFKAFVDISRVYDWTNNGRKKLEKDIKVITL